MSAGTKPDLALEVPVQRNIQPVHFEKLVVGVLEAATIALQQELGRDLEAYEAPTREAMIYERAIDMAQQTADLGELVTGRLGNVYTQKNLFAVSPTPFSTSSEWLRGQRTPSAMSDCMAIDKYIVTAYSHCGGNPMHLIQRVGMSKLRAIVPKARKHFLDESKSEQERYEAITKLVEFAETHTVGDVRQILNHFRPTLPDFDVTTVRYPDSETTEYHVTWVLVDDDFALFRRLIAPYLKNPEAEDLEDPEEAAKYGL